MIIMSKREMVTIGRYYAVLEDGKIVRIDTDKEKLAKRYAWHYEDHTNECVFAIGDILSTTIPICKEVMDSAEVVNEICGTYCTPDAIEDMLNLSDEVDHMVADSMDNYAILSVGEYMECGLWDALSNAEFSTYYGFRYDGIYDICKFLLACESLEETYAIFPEKYANRLPKFRKVLMNCLYRVYGYEAWDCAKYLDSWRDKCLAVDVVYNFAEKVLEWLDETFNAELHYSEHFENRIHFAQTNMDWAELVIS